MKQIGMKDRWRFLVKNIGNPKRIVIFIKPKTGEIALFGIYRQHGKYTYELSRFKQDNIRNRVKIEIKKDGEIDSSIVN